MRIGIDATCWDNQRGFGRFTRELLRALFAHGGGHRYTVFFDGAAPDELAAFDLTIVRMDTRARVIESAVASGRRRIADILACTRATRAHALDVFLFPAVYSWFPLFPGRRSVVAVHDAIAEGFPDLVFTRRSRRLFWAAKMRLALWQASRVLTVSQTSKREIVRHLGVAADRIDVTTEGADRKFRRCDDAAQLLAARAAIGLPPDARFLLFVGGLAPHKNLIGLLQGFERALASDAARDLYLVIAGDPAGAGFHSCAEQVHHFAAASERLRGRILFPGFVPDATLVGLYSSALAVAMPAFSEGFGLPAIEALACGTPVLSSASGAVPEVIGEAGLLFDPHAPQTMADAMVRISGDATLVCDLRSKALQRAKGYSWERSAALTLASLRRACARA